MMQVQSVRESKRWCTYDWEPVGVVVSASFLQYKKRRRPARREEDDVDGGRRVPRSVAR